jgi:hypothetical protein
MSKRSVIEKCHCFNSIRDVRRYETEVTRVYGRFSRDEMHENGLSCPGKREPCIFVS